MANYGGYYKEEKKKPKKGKGGAKVTVISGSPIFTLPEIIGRRKKGGEG